MARKKKQKAPVGPPARDPLLAVPEAADHVEEHLDTRDWVHLRMEVPPKGRIATWLAERFNARRYNRINLDAMGSKYWMSVDGVHNLYDIADILASEFQLSVEQSREATARFTRDLMLRHLIYLRIEDTED